MTESLLTGFQLGIEDGDQVEVVPARSNAFERDVSGGSSSELKSEDGF